MNRFFRILIIIIVGNAFMHRLYGQVSELRNNNSKSQDTITAVKSLMIGMDYYSNTNTLDTYSNDDVQASISPVISFYGKSGLILSGAALFIQNADTLQTGMANEYDLEAGYRWDINQSLSLTPTYTHYLYSKNMNQLRSDYTDYFDLTFDAQSNWLFGSIAPSYALGSKNTFILESQAGFNIQFDNFLGKDHALTIQPTVDVNFNNQDYYYKYAYIYFAFLQKYAENNPGATIDDFRAYMENNPSKLRVINRYLSRHPRVNKAYNNIGSGTVLSSLFETTTKFTLSSVNITLPISYSINSLSIKAIFSIYKPLNQPSYMNGDWSFMFSLGVNYSFNW